jgi:acetoin utilization protein AcuB
MREVGEVMTPRVVSIGAEDRLLTVDDIMTLGQLRHLPVVRSGELVGVISERDLLRASPSHLELQDVEERRFFLNSIEVQQAMSSPAIVIGAKASLRQAAELMVAKDIGCLPVTDDSGELQGMLSRRDVLMSISGSD